MKIEFGSSYSVSFEASLVIDCLVDGSKLINCPDAGFPNWR